MRAKLIIIIALTLVGLLSQTPAYSQDSPKSNKKMEKKLAKQRKEKGKEARKSDKEAMDAHYKAQGKQTRKRMKKSKKKSKRVNKNKKDPFWKKWFSDSLLIENRWESMDNIIAKNE
jgi:hypothetical protein